MQNLDNINHYLLPTSYRKYGWMLVLVAVPVVMLLSFIMPLDGWGIYLFHVPISTGLFMIFLSREQEDELYLSLRMKAAVHSLKYILVLVISFPVILSVSRSLQGEVIQGIPDLGGNIAVVSFLLFLANLIYYRLKKGLEA